MPKEEEPQINNIGQVKIRNLKDEMEDSYIDYAMSVIVSRALPDVRDGLKPVQRRILYAMYGMGARHDTKFRKSAAVTGEVLGKYHPHGDSSVYGALVRMAQNFSLRYTLIRGQGNFGSIDGDPPAAQRYTECKLEKIGEEMLKDIEKETVDVNENYDATRTEPLVLPAPIPNLLLNGATGIAVGMATNIPTHNLNEVCDALIHLIDNRETDPENLFKFIKGPDFPTRGFIFDEEAIKSAYMQGKGSFVTRGKVEIIEKEKGGSQIIITEIPYQVDKSVLITTFANLVQNKRIEGIRDIRDESDKDGMRIAIDLQKGAIPKKILNSLYKYTDLQKTFHLNMIALVNGIEPRVLSLKDVLDEYLKHRLSVLLRRAKYDLAKAKEREHILEGLMIALGSIDEVIETIKASKAKEDAKNNLVKKFDLSIPQAEAILEIRLHQLARLEKQKIEDELKELLKTIKGLELILKSEDRQKEVLKEELEDVKKNYGDERKTQIVKTRAGEISIEDMVKEEDAIIILTEEGYIKRMNPDEYKKQKRGGVGTIGMRTREEDGIEHFLHANTHDTLFFFTDSGKVFRTKAYEVPEGLKINKGKGIMNFLEISPNDKILSILALSKDEEKAGYLIMATEKGVVKKTKLENFENVRRNGLIAINLKPNDALRQVERIYDGDDVLLATSQGMSIRFKGSDVRAMGRQASGIRGIRLKPSDKVVGMVVVSKDNQDAGLLVLSQNGYGKITQISDYKIQKRGGSGIKISKVTSKTGSIVKPEVIKNQEDLIVISQKGQTIRTKISNIPRLGRDTQGVKIMRLKAGDKVVSATTLL
ncbi:MAG: DNA gyrase subunit A [Candidatus Pacebacteria bacterium]|nr:DNA gyrase subunit A [Candidatus Paceibacterota bacterium]